MVSEKNERVIDILLATYNGEKYLHKQIDSLLKQDYRHWNLIIHDDNSTDKTLSIIQEYQKKYPSKISLIEDDIGFGSAKANFSFLIKQSNAKYIMFTDQDDVWKENKITITLKKMQDMEKLYPNAPVLVHSDLHVTDELLNIVDKSLWNFEHNNPYKDTLNRLIYQNTATGSTMMLNKKLVKLASPIAKDAIMHDWWITLVASAFGYIGAINEQTIYYRQHQKNLIGAKKYSKILLIKKILMMISFQNEAYLLHLHQHRKQAEEFLTSYHNMLTNKDIEMLKCFINLPKMSWIQKRMNIIKYRCFKQSFIQTISILIRV